VAGTDGNDAAVAFLVDRGRIVRIDGIRNPAKLRRLRSQRPLKRAQRSSTEGPSHPHSETWRRDGCGLTPRRSEPANPIAAVPSLHAGFAVAVSAARAGNHFVTDIVAGVAVTVAGYVLGRLARIKVGQPGIAPVPAVAAG
jgi:hypothetical protein